MLSRALEPHADRIVTPRVTDVIQRADLWVVTSARRTDRHARQQRNVMPGGADQPRLAERYDPIVSPPMLEGASSRTNGS